MAANDAALDKILGALPIATYRTGEAVLTAGSKTGQLLILKSGAVAIIKGSIEIARVKEPGAVIGELSALLDQPHTADVKALEDWSFVLPTRRCSRRIRSRSCTSPKYWRSALSPSITGLLS